MNVVKRLVREPNLILGVITTGMSVLVLFGVDITKEQIGGVGLFVGALVLLIRFIVTPSAEVVLQQKPSGALVAGPAAPAPTGTQIEEVAFTPVG